MIGNIIIIAVIAVAGAFALKSTIGHLKGEGGCCGGGSGSIEIDKELDSPVIEKRTYKVEGMHCDHCRVNIKNALNRLDGVKAEVSLKKSTAEVSLSKDVSDDVIKRAVEDVGYKIV